MFSKTSRYRKLDDVVASDAAGRPVSAKSLRLLPKVTGTFVHTVEAGDRLDHLAHKYYKQPGKWWRICDANPEYLSPLALLGNKPLVTQRISLSASSATETLPLAGLLRLLSGAVGIEEVQVAEDVRVVSEEQRTTDEVKILYHQIISYALIITYNRLNLSEQDLIAKIRESLQKLDAEGVMVPQIDIGQPETIGRIGKSITIPQDIIT